MLVLILLGAHEDEIGHTQIFLVSMCFITYAIRRFRYYMYINVTGVRDYIMLLGLIYLKLGVLCVEKVSFNITWGTRR